jgi:alpha-tubulin suppressor-like RCC1 family protein
VGATTDLWSEVQLGQSHSCGFKQDKTLWCWGSNRDGQLGTGTSWTREPQIVE